MAQEVSLNPQLSTFGAVQQGAVRIHEIEKQLVSLEQKFADPEYFQNDKRLAHLIDQQELAYEADNHLGGTRT